MSKIWFFGDSYAANNHFLKAKSWTKTVQEAFPEYDSENLALVASSLDYLYYTYEQKRKEFNSGDIVIMSLTSLERLSLRDDKEPTHRFFGLYGIISVTCYTACQVTLSTCDTEYIAEDHPWYGYFADDLFNPKTHQATLNLFLNSLKYDAKTKGIKIIALPITDFPFLDREDEDHITLGKTQRSIHLSGVSKKQMETKFSRKWDNSYYTQAEWRAYDRTLVNHLTPRNNEILANKVIKNIKTNEPIDLTTEWEY